MLSQVTNAACSYSSSRFLSTRHGPGAVLRLMHVLVDSAQSEPLQGGPVVIPVTDDEMKDLSEGQPASKWQNQFP